MVSWSRKTHGSFRCNNWQSAEVNFSIIDEAVKVKFEVFVKFELLEVTDEDA